MLCAQQVRINTKDPARRSCSVWSTRTAWDQLNDSSRLGRNSMASGAITIADQRLAEDTTCIYQGMQTKTPIVTVISVTPTSALQDSRTRSSQVVKILLSQITRRLDCTSDNRQTREDNAGKSNVTALMIHT